MNSQVAAERLGSCPNIYLSLDITFLPRHMLFTPPGFLVKCVTFSPALLIVLVNYPRGAQSGKA